MKTIRNSILGTALLLAGAGCGGTQNWDPGYTVGTKIHFTITQTSTSVDKKWVDGAGSPTDQSSTILVGNALQSGGSHTTTQSVTVDRTWHIIGKGYEHVGTDLDDDSEHRPVYFVEGVDVITGAGSDDQVQVRPDGNGGTITDTTHQDGVSTNQTQAYQFVLYGAHGDNVEGGTELGQDGFVYAYPLTAGAPADVNGLVTKINPSSGEVWFQNNGIYRVIDGEDVASGSGKLSASRVEVRTVTSPDTSTSPNYLQLCVNEGTSHTQDTEVGTNINTSNGSSNTELTLDEGCQNQFVSLRTGTLDVHENIPVQFSGTLEEINVTDYGYEWINCDLEGQNKTYQTSHDQPGQDTLHCGSTNKFIQYTVTEVSNRNVTLDDWTVEPLPNK